MTYRYKEFDRKELAASWFGVAVSTFMAAVSFRHGDLVWGFVFTPPVVFFGLVAVGGHLHRQWNRHGEPDWARRARERRGL